MISVESGGYLCKACGHGVAIENGIVFFHPEEKNSNSGMEGCILDDVAEYEEKHFWMSARRSYLGAIFKKFVKPEESILEIGAGTGYVAKYLISQGYRDYSIGDINERGLELSGQCACRHKYQFNVMRDVFTEHFDVVGMFDVLEHLDDDGLAVKNIKKMLKKGGRIIVIVPAHKWLWSKQDAIAYHKRRYEIEELKDLFLKNDFNILKVSGFFLSLIPFMYVRKNVNRDDGMLCEKDYRERFKVNGLLNMLLEVMLRIETAIFINFPSRYGGSIVLVAKK